MSSIYLLVGAFAAFLLAYQFYARKIAGNLELDDKFPTPAHTLEDNVDYVPTKVPVLLGHHFSSIAGAAPIIGPIVAAGYGWGPVFIWIVLGSIFLGAVHDLTAMVASVRHSGRSIGEVIEVYLGRTGKILFLVFCWSTLILVIAVFMQLVASTFVENPATASSSGLYMILALIFGICVFRLKISYVGLTLVFLPLLFLSIWAGILFPLAPDASGITVPFLSLTLSPNSFWIIILLIYIFIASVTPVWLLLQPRDYLSSFLLYALIIGGLTGVFFAKPELDLEMFRGFRPGNMEPMIPMLFVIVACGAISGFHSLVASGTSAKQLNRETDAVPVAYGGMLIEGLLAVLALITAARFTFQEYSISVHQPISLFSNGIAAFMTSIYIPFTNIKLPLSANACTTFAMLAVSAFALTTLDTATRLSRFCLQELFTPRGTRNGVRRKSVLDRYTATFVCVVVSGILGLSGQWRMIWPLFGAANQLLAALTLLTVSVWIFHIRRNVWYTLVPTCLMFGVTLSALALMFFKNAGSALALLNKQTLTALEDDRLLADGILSIITLLLFFLALILLVLSVKTFLRMGRERGRGTGNPVWQ